MNIGFLFDLDGVLIDSETEYTRIWSDIDRVYPTGVENFATKIKGMTLPEILELNFPKEIWPKVVGMLNEREQKMKYNLLPGALELLTKLKERDYPRALVTSSNDLKMQHLHEELPWLEDEFTVVVTADMITKSKPDPEGYILAARLIGVPTSRCAVFEDSRQGVKAGHASGAYTVGLTTTLPEPEIAPYCDKIVANLAAVDLDKLVATLEARE